MKKFGLLGTSALRSAVFVGVVVASVSPALAQNSQPAPGDELPTQPSDPAALGQNEVELESGRTADEGATGETILVTGSRIRRPNLESTVPITSVGAVELTQRGDVSLGDALNELPSLRSTFSQANSTRFIGTAGLNLLDLRGLGTERTLVLVNGRRHVTATPGSYEVDTNTIPTDLVERVDVVTGGNSAIYGSDAVAGVVNFVLKRDYEGVALRGQGGVSSYGDRGTYFVSALAGKNFLDNRLNIAGSVEYAKTNAVYFLDRPYSGAATGVGPAGFETVEPTFRLVNGVPVAVPNRNNNGVANTRFLPSGFTFNTVSLGGTVLTTCPVATAANQARVNAVCTGELSPTSGGRFGYNFVFDAAGNLLRNGPENGLVDNRASGGSALFGLGASGLEGAQLLPGLERITANVLLNADIATAFQPFLEAKYVRIKAEQASEQPTFIASTLNPIFSINNPFLSPQARATLQTILAPGATQFQIQRFNNDIGTRTENHRRETYRIVGGFAGDLSETGNLRYEVALNYGRTETYYETGGNVDVAKFNRATNAVRNAQGQIVCAVNADASTTNDDASCVPLNVFGQGAPSRAAIDYVLFTSSREENAEQLNATAFLSGDSTGLFELPGGAVGFAIGAEYRKETAYSAYDEFTQTGATFLNAAAPFDPPAAKIKEVFGELRVPLLKDRPFFHELSVEGAARYTKQNGSEGVWAYNVGGIWAPVRDLRIRGGYARSVRAPNLGNLFGTRSETFVNGLVDPCNQTVINDNPNRARNCAAAGIPTTMVVDGNTIPYANVPASGVSGFNQGNPLLTPEVGKSITIGAVLQPRFLPGFSFTVDYYKIKIENVISGLSGQTIINRCYDDPNGLDNPFCAAVFRRRDPNPLIDFTFAGQADRAPGPGVPNITFPRTGPAFLNQPFNFAALRAEGVDFDLAYRGTISDGIVMNLRGIATYVINRENFTSIADPSFGTQFRGTLGDPKWAATFSANFDFGVVDLTYRANYIGPQLVGAFNLQNEEQGRPATNPDAFPFKSYPDVIYHAFRAGFEVNKQFDFYAGVDNAFNRKPPFGITGTGAGGGIFPVTQRFFYAGFEAKF